MADTSGACPPRCADIKKEIAAAYPDFAARATKAWGEILAELDTATKEIARQGSKAVHEVAFADLPKLSAERIEEIKRTGSLVIRDVVDDAEALSWQAALREFVTKNPVEGMPADDKQFFQIYWSQSQVRARSHPNVVQTTMWLNNTYHMRSNKDVKSSGVDLDAPLMYADRFRIRHPGGQWNAHPPHIDGGSIERWEEKNFRKCYGDILSGDWRKHDPYDLENRINAKSSLYGRPNQSSVFRTYQGWLALSETAPNEGTLQVFPNVILSNAYIILRPFFSLVEGADPNSFDPKDWKLDLDNPDFPGIRTLDNGFHGPRPTPLTHPHLRLTETMVSVPKVYPGDMVFWHGDVIHAVETMHVGKGDSAVMYIPAVPYTPQNAAYVERQRESFLRGETPPDFPKTAGEGAFAGKGVVDDFLSPLGKRAMGFQVQVA